VTGQGEETDEPPKPEGASGDGKEE